MKILATYNIKGGVGKTATAVNLGYLAAKDGYRVLLWDLDDGHEVLGVHHRGTVTAAFNPDGLRLATAGLDGTVKLWETCTGRQTAPIVPITAFLASSRLWC